MRTSCGGDIIVISPRDGGASQRDLSTFAGWQPSALAVHDRDLGPGGLADRTRLASSQRVCSNLGGGFRHAVGLDHRDAEQGFQLAEHVGRQRRRGRTNDPQRALLDAALVAIRRRQQRPMDCREPPCTRSVETPSASRRRRRHRTPGVQTTARPGRQRRQQPGDQAMRMEQRQHVQQPVPRSKCQAAPAL